MSFLLLLLDLLVLGVDHFIRHSTGRIGSVFACKRIHDATVRRGEDACVGGLMDGDVTWYGWTGLDASAPRPPNSPQTRRP